MAGTADALRARIAVTVIAIARKVKEIAHGIRPTSAAREAIVQKIGIGTVVESRSS